MYLPNIERRQFLHASWLGATAALFPWDPVVGDEAKSQAPLRFGVIADVHKDVMHDADQRLQVFVDAMNEDQVDFVLQLGDFCVPTTENLDFLKIWNTFSGPRYHVLGNHDTNGNETDHPQRFRREETVEYWGMPSRYYSFDQKQVHVVGPSPWDMGASREELDAATLVPKISNWKTPV